MCKNQHRSTSGTEATRHCCVLVIYTHLHIFLSADCPKNGETTEDTSGASERSQARSYERKREETAACRKPITVTVCNIAEVNGSVRLFKNCFFGFFFLVGYLPASLSCVSHSVVLVCLEFLCAPFLPLFPQLFSACAPSILAGAPQAASLPAGL